MSLAFILLGLAQSVTPTVDTKAMLGVFQDFITDDKITADSLDKAYAAKDKYGQHLPLPPRKMLLSEADENKDGVLTVDELKAWKGYEGRAYCRNPGDAMYGCLDRCLGGVDHIDGDPSYFDKYTTEQGTYVEDDKMEVSYKKRGKYHGGYSRAQRMVLKKSIVEYASKNPGGAIVQMGMKDMHSWRLFFDTLKTAGDTKSEIYLVDSFEGFAKCSDVYDTGMCPPKGSAAIDRKALEADIKEWGDSSRVQIVKSDYKSSAGLPKKISLAVIDGALHETVLDQLKAIHPNLAPGAIVYIHDFGWEGFPGVERALTEYTNGEGKGMKVVMPGSEDGVACYLGKMTK